MHTKLTTCKKYYDHLRMFFGGMNPHKQWMLLLRASLIVCTIIIVASFYLLVQIKQQQIFQVTKLNGTGAVVDQSLLTIVNATVHARTDNQNNIQASQPVADPSIQ